MIDIIQIDFEFNHLTRSPIEGEKKLFIAILSRIIMDAVITHKIIINYETRRSQLAKYPSINTFLRERDDIYYSVKSNWIKYMCEITDIDYARFKDYVEDVLFVDEAFIQHLKTNKRNNTIKYSEGNDAKNKRKRSEFNQKV